MTEQNKAMPCPRCGGTAMEARGTAKYGKHTLLSGFYWYCFGDGETPVGQDCEFEGPHCDSSNEALSAWNALTRNAAEQRAPR